MRRALPILCGVLVAAVPSVAAEKEPPPLEATKKELQQFVRDQNNQATTTTPGLKVDAPTLQVQPPVLDATQWWQERKQAAERKQEKADKRQNQNWLVNGVERTRTESTNAANGHADREETSGTGEANIVDTSEPDYLLKLYDEQGKTAARKAEPEHRRPVADPFAPFLQDWLGDSPVRGQFFDEFVKGGADATGVSTLPGGTSGIRGATDPISTPAGLPGVGVAEKTNPYLVDAIVPAPVVNAGPSPVPAATPVAPQSISPGGFGLSGDMSATRIPEARTPRSGPPPGPTDDKKYFPQLKRF